MDAGDGMQLGLLGVTGWVSPTLAAPEADLSDSSSSRAAAVAGDRGLECRARTHAGAPSPSV